MPKSSSIYTRVEPELKEQAEKVLSKLGMPMANAINLFLHQVVLQEGIPFDVKLPQRKPLDPSKKVSARVRNIGFMKGPPLPDSFFDPLPDEELELWGL